MTQAGYALLGLTALTAMLVGVLTFALLRIVAGTRDTRRHLRENSADAPMLSAALQEAVTKLKAQPGKDILLDGSSVLVHTLIENDLVDEFRLHVYPLSVGGGKRLFPAGKRVNLKLVESQALPTGVVYQHLILVP